MHNRRIPSNQPVTMQKRTVGQGAHYTVRKMPNLRQEFRRGRVREPAGEDRETVGAPTGEEGESVSQPAKRANIVQYVDCYNYDWDRKQTTRRQLIFRKNSEPPIYIYILKCYLRIRTKRNFSLSSL
jgi:hypothetical protein